MGIAYQIKDDMDDNLEDAESDDVEACRPSIFMSMASERSSDEQKEAIKGLWTEGVPVDKSSVRSVYSDLKLDERVNGLLESYKEEAVRHLMDLSDPSLKGLLRRVMGKIFNDIEVKGWCHEFEPGDDSSRASSAESAG